MFLIIDPRIVDRDAYVATVKQWGPAAHTAEAHGGRLLVCGDWVAVIDGAWKPTNLLIVEFPDAEFHEQLGGVQRLCGHGGTREPVRRDVRRRRLDTQRVAPAPSSARSRLPDCGQCADQRDPHLQTESGQQDPHRPSIRYPNWHCPRVRYTKRVGPGTVAPPRTEPAVAVRSRPGRRDGGGRSVALAGP